MAKTPVQTDKAPAAAGPYSQAVAIDGLLFTSGVIPIDPQTGTIPQADIATHTHQVLKNLSAVAQAGGTALSHAVKVTVFLTDMTSFQEVNAVYSTYFEEPYPARSAIGVAALPLGAALEIEAVFELKS